MHQPTPESPTSDFSLISSIDALSISPSSPSTHSRRSSAFSNLSRYSTATRSRDPLSPTDGFDVISRASRSERSSLSLVERPESSASSRVSARSRESKESGLSKQSQRSGQSERTSGASKSAKRRERKKQLEESRAVEAVLTGDSKAEAGAEEVKIERGTGKTKAGKRDLIAKDVQANKPAVQRDTGDVKKEGTGEAVFPRSTKVGGVAPVDSGAEASGESAEKKKGTKTRRGGKRAKARLEKVRDALEIEDELFLDSGDGTPPRPLAGAPRPTIKVSSSYGDEMDDEDEVDDMSALGEAEDDGLGTPRSTPRRILRSTLSSEDAKSSIDSFLSDTEAFISDKANKLRLWQSLCIELGVVSLAEEDLPDLPTDRHHAASSSPTPSESRSATPTPTRPCLPTTLSQARTILKNTAHVNIVDFFEARASNDPEAMRDLVYPSRNAMMKDARKDRKLAKLGSVKEEWLEPLLKDFGFKRGRTRPPGIGAEE